MANKILHKRSNISGDSPELGSLDSGELAINTGDGYLFFKKSSESGNYLCKFIDLEGQSHILNASLSGFIPQFGNNSISEVFASILGGFGNIVNGAASSIVNGENNKIESDFSSTVNGINNNMDLGADYSFIAGGQNNRVSHSNVFTLGSNLSSHAANFTYANNISATGKIYGDGSGLTGIVAEGVVGPDTVVRSLTSNWENTYTTVQSNSSTWNYQGTDIKSLTANWVGGNDAYTNLVSNSAAYLSAIDLSFLSVSGNWNDVYTTVQTNSSSWGSSQQTSKKYDFVEMSNYSISYFGSAPLNSSESAQVWAITKTTYTDVGSISSTQVASNVSWTDRLIVNYV